MGVLWSAIDQSFPPQSKFIPEIHIPDLSGKVVIVTGGNTGIGFHTVKELLKKDAKVYMASRSKDKATLAIQQLKEITGKEAIFLHLDLADLDLVTKATNEFKSKESALHILFNSGGVTIPPIDQITANGYDLQFGTNVLGHAHFTLNLIPELLAGAKTSRDGKARIINTSSGVVYLGPKGGIVWDTLGDTEARKKLGTTMLYSQSKIGVVLFSNEIAERYADQGIISNSVNPGNLKTELQRHVSPIQRKLLNLILYPAENGALTQLWAGTSPEAKDFNSKFLIPWARVGDAGAAGRNQENQTKLWEWISEQRKGH